ncbi:tryptophan halogenase [Caulobacter ginsengisoli]|uniref:Tryptophan halogenase n=1 Tax=Caulobacter ginsengisoli TaxID=400775 RepID=A0ABU0IQN5_9CAUL|nr:tryptophan 7-halogenase [Caulobacter ginsengisoli]MDQ0464330.1 tryptophan halogenase [Caulobacter ginsengisoli]
MKPTRTVLIVGGGTAGWLTAAYLAKALNAASPEGVAITLIESPDIGILGVGEGTFPSIRGTLSAIGVNEARFLEASNATFKQGVRFNNWVRPKGTPGPDHYFHPFSLPSQRTAGLELLPYWLMGEAPEGVAFAEAVTMQKRVADASRGPKKLGDGDFLGPMNYAYHFDATRFAAFMREEAKALGVVHLQGKVERVDLDETGAIAGLATPEHGQLSADLYIDCSGFRAALIGAALGSPFKPLADHLFVDRALAIQVPYDRPDHPIASYTISTAHEAGWTWDIGLKERRGVGYVYSSRHTGDDRAEAVLRGYLGGAGSELPVRQLQFEVGYRERQWAKNCVAVGLSGGFLEPLESSGIGLIETAAYLIAHLFPFDGQMDRTAVLFNELMSKRYARVVDFLKLHYCLSQRTDSAFWTDNTNAASIPESLAAKLEMWRCRPPHRLDFVTDLEMYLPASWQFVLYGMEFKTDMSGARAGFTRTAAAREEFAMLPKVAARAVDDLPDHRDLVERLCARGLGRAA